MGILLIDGISIALKMCIFSTISCVLFLILGTITYEIGIVSLRALMLNSKSSLGVFLKEHLGIWMISSLETTTNRDTLRLLFSLTLTAVSVAVVKYLFWLESKYIRVNLSTIKNWPIYQSILEREKNLEMRNWKD